MIKTFRKLGLALVAVLATCLTLVSCSNDDDNNAANVDYSKDIIGTWYYEKEGYADLYEIRADGTFEGLGGSVGNTWAVEGKWTLKQDYLVLTTNEGKTQLSGTIAVYANDVMLLTSDETKETLVYHYYEPQPFPARLVGTWTCLEPGFAEALTIREDGSVLTTGVKNGEYWENQPGIFLEGEGEYGIEIGETYRWGSYEVVAGELLVFIDQTNTRHYYHYCKEDLSEEIVGMWVCNDAPVDTENNMGIQEFDANGIATLTGYTSQVGDFIVKSQANYKVIGDLLIQKLPEENLIAGVSPYLVLKVVYAPNENALGDMMIQKRYVVEGNNTVEMVSSWLRVKQSLDLTGLKFGYNKTYVTNVKGLNKEVDFMGFKFNFAEMDGSRLDKMLKTILFEIEFPNANTIKYSCRHSGNKVVTVEAPMVVEGNKVTVKVSEVYPGFKDVDLYCFQDADNCQLHIYMPTYAFEAFFGNMQVMMMTQLGELDTTDEAAVKAVYDSVANAVETINVSLVMDKTMK